MGEAVGLQSPLPNGLVAPTDPGLTGPGRQGELDRAFEANPDVQRTTAAGQHENILGDVCCVS